MSRWGHLRGFAATPKHQQAYAGLLLDQGFFQFAVTLPRIHRPGAGGQGALPQAVQEYSSLLAGSLDAGLVRGCKFGQQVFLGHRCRWRRCGPCWCRFPGAGR